MDLKQSKIQTVKKQKKIQKRQPEILVRYSFAEHYTALRSVVLWSVVVYLVATIIAYYYAADVYNFLSKPLLLAFEQYHGSNLAPRRFIYTGITEAFFTYMNLAFYLGFILSFPIIAYQVYSFFAPALYQKERRLLLPYLFLAPILFGVGVLFAYFVVMPISWQFFLSFEHLAQISDQAIPVVLEAKISEYLASVVHLIVAFGVAFQTPLVVVLLFDAGIITVATLKKIRRYMIVGAFVIAAILTPPDVLSQISLAIPLVLLYEMALMICSIKKKKIK